MIEFVIGMFVGSFLTVFGLGLCKVAGEADEMMEKHNDR